MKTFYLLALKDNGNKVICEFDCSTEEQAIYYFNNIMSLDVEGKTIPLQLNDRGYQKVGEVSYCIAESLK